MALPSKGAEGEALADDDEVIELLLPPPLIRDARFGKTDEKTDPLEAGAFVVGSSSPMEMKGSKDFHPDFRSLIAGSSGGGGARIALTICLVTSASNPTRGENMEGNNKDPWIGLGDRMMLKIAIRKVIVVMAQEE